MHDTNELLTMCCPIIDMVKPMNQNHIAARHGNLPSRMNCKLVDDDVNNTVKLELACAISANTPSSSMIGATTIPAPMPSEPAATPDPSDSTAHLMASAGV